MKEIAVAGDILELCEECYLNMLTIYGQFTVVNHLNSKSTTDLIEALVENLAKLGSYGWCTKYLFFDSEGVMAAHKRQVEIRTGCHAVIQSHGSKVGTIEMNNSELNLAISLKSVNCAGRFAISYLVMAYAVLASLLHATYDGGEWKPGFVIVLSA